MPTRLTEVGVSWAKLDDQLPFNKKLKGLSSDAKWLWVTSLCYSCAQLSDGFVDADDVELLIYLARVPATAAEELVVWHSWEPLEHLCARCRARYKALVHTGASGFVIHDFLDYQPAGKTVETRRRDARLRQAKHRGSGDNKSSGVTA